MTFPLQENRLWSLLCRTRFFSGSLQRGGSFVVFVRLQFWNVRKIEEEMERMKGVQYRTFFLLCSLSSPHILSNVMGKLPKTLDKWHFSNHRNFYRKTPAEEKCERKTKLKAAVKYQETEESRVHSCVCTSPPLFPRLSIYTASLSLPRFFIYFIQQSGVCCRCYIFC